MSNKKVRGEFILEAADKEELERLAKGGGEDAHARVHANILLAYSAGKTVGWIKSDLGIGTGDVRRCLKLAIDHGVKVAVSGQVPEAKKPRHDYIGLAKYAACFLVLVSTSHWTGWAVQRGFISAGAAHHLDEPLSLLAFVGMGVLLIGFTFKLKNLAEPQSFIESDGKIYHRANSVSAAILLSAETNPGHANDTSIMHGESARDFRRRIARMEKKRGQKAG